MPRNPNLVPTLITDINGVTKTVHKKPEGASRTKTIPSPPRALSKQEKIQHLLRRVEEVNGEFQASVEFDTWQALNQWYPVSYYPELEVHLQRDPVVASGVAAQIARSDDPNVINETVYFYPLLGIEDYDEVRALVIAMGQYEAFEAYGDLSTVDQKTQKQCIALMRATKIIRQQSTMDKNDPDYPMEYISIRDSKWECFIIREESTVALIVEQPKDAERIAAVVAKHGHLAKNEILGIMDGITPSLADGAL